MPSLGWHTRNVNLLCYSSIQYCGYRFNYHSYTKWAVAFQCRKEISSAIKCIKSSAIKCIRKGQYRHRNNKRNARVRLYCFHVTSIGLFGGTYIRYNKDDIRENKIGLGKVVQKWFGLGAWLKLVNSAFTAYFHAGRLYAWTTKRNMVWNLHDI